MEDYDHNIQEQNKTDRNLLLKKFEELQQQHEQSLRDSAQAAQHQQQFQDQANNYSNSTEEFEDIQFFHRLPQLQPVKLTGMNGGGDVVRGGLYDFTTTSENPFVFPDNVMEYGEPQFFPGNCVGYLETIQEETDEEYEEEEGCSGRHWWTADSDTDTDSVIRVDRVAAIATNPSTVNESCQIPMSATTARNFPESLSNTSANLASFSGHFPSIPFRTTASSKPFEMEDLYLFDQLDLAFEETLTKPRARTGFAFTGSNDHPILPHSAPPETQVDEKPVELNGFAPPGQEEGSRERTSSSSDDEQPAEVNEEDFFYSTSEENSSLTETTSSESEESSSDEGGNKDGVVLAEFSLTAGFNNGLFKSHRRSFEGTPNSKSKLKSFRSFDSLNSLAGTELLFSKADTFPSFHEFIKDATGESGEIPVSPTAEQEEGSHQNSPIISDKVEVTRKSSGEMSSENLSEDSGICDGAGSNGGSVSGVHDGKFIAKSAFALNPLLVYSSPSASEENSMEATSLGSNHSPTETPNHPGSSSLEDQSNQLETNHSPGSCPLSSKFESAAPSTGGNNPVQLLSGSPHPSSPEYLEQILSEPLPANFPDKNYAEEKEVEAETPASTQNAPVKTNSSPSLTTASRPILTAFRRNSLESTQSGQGQGFPGPSASSIGVGGYNNSYSDTDSDEDEEFTMLERQAQGYFGELEYEQAQAPAPSNNNCISELNASPCANEIPGVELKVSSSTVTDYNKSISTCTDIVPNSYVNGNNANAESESEQCSDIHTEDGQGVNSCVIKSGPMSTLANTPTTPLSPYSNSGSSSTFNSSLRSTANGNANTEEGNNNINMDMDYFKSFESEILSEAEVEAHYYRPGEFGSKKPQAEEQQPSTLTTHPVSSSVSLEPGGREDGDSFQLLPKNKKKKHPGAVVTGEFQLPSSSSASKVISGRSNFGSRKVENVVYPDSCSSEEEEDEGPGVSEPLVVKKKTWTCAVDVVDESQNPEIGLGVVPRNQNPNVPDILQIQSAQQSGNSMEVVSAERPGSISPHVRNGSGGSGTGTPSPVPIKTYGSRGEVEVFLVSSRTPSPSSPKPPPPMEAGTGLLTGAGGSSTPGPGESGTLKSNKTVHFSPVVSEISWRESYTDQGSEFSESSSTENHYDDGRDDEDEDTLTMANEDEVMGRMPQHNNKQAIERVHVQSQVMQEPIPLTTTQQISPSGDNAPNTLSMVPDLLSQCSENVNLASHQENHTQHIEVRIEEQHPGENEKSPKEFVVTQSQPQQQQIFPAMFADTKDSKSGVKSNVAAPAAGKKSAKKGFILGKNKEKDKDKVGAKGNNSNPMPNNEETKQQKQDKEKDKEKPSFFQRLSKIRLSGSSGNKSKKAKIHPKEKENAEPTIIGIGKDEVDRKAGEITPVVAAPILKKNGTNGTVGQPPATTDSAIYYNKNGHVMNSQIHEGEECSAAFESILEEIAGLNTIRTRQARASDNKRTFAERNQFLSNPEIDRSKDRESDTLESKLSQFKADASKTRDEIAKSHPDFETIEDVTRSKATTTASPKATSTSSPTLSDSSPPKSPTGENNEGQSGSEKKREREWYKLLKSAAEKYYYGGKVSRSQPTAAATAENPPGPGFRSTGIVETDLDTGASREMLDAELIDLEFEKPVIIASSPPPRPPLPKSPTSGNGKARSLTNLHGGGGLKFSLPPDSFTPNGGNGVIDIDTLCTEAEERAKSFEFLLDETQKSSSVPPENQLRNEARQLSEHELRIQRSLQKLNVPDWYRKHGHHDNQLSLVNERSSADPTTTTTDRTTAALKLLKRADYGSASGLAGGWAGLSAYRTPSLSSLQNSGRYTGSLTRSNFVRGRPATMSAMRSSRESLLSPSSTASHSPSAFERCSFTYGMPYSLSRYGTSRLSSTSGASPVNSSPPATPGPLSAAASTRKPYLGWRSQERLNAAAAAPGGPGAPKLSFYRPPAERLAAEVLTLRQKATPNPLRPTGVDRPPLPKPPPRAGKQKEQNETPTPILPNSPSVHDSIREVTDAINQFVSHGQDEPPRPTPRQKSGKKQSVWIESSFVGRKPHVTN